VLLTLPLLRSKSNLDGGTLSKLSHTHTHTHTHAPRNPARTHKSGQGPVAVTVSQEADLMDSCVCARCFM
jgi:hypothetical protein